MKSFLLPLQQIDKVVKYVASLSKEHTIILLNGDLASGKTTFVKYFAKYFGIDDFVSSPTFSICNVYNDKIYHYDIYNSSSDDFIQLGLLHQLDVSAIHIIEWSDTRLNKLIKEFGWYKIEIQITVKNDKREYRIDSE
jgi:tRNA threonylcarbamoyladenosine biosynthesis protein TsaE